MMRTMLTVVDIRDIYARCSAAFADRVHAIDGRWDETLDATAVAAVREWFAGMEATYRDMGVVGPRVEIPSDAGPQAQLLAMMGRTP